MTGSWDRCESPIFGLSTNLGFISTNLREFLYQTGGFTFDKAVNVSILFLDFGREF